MTHKLSTTFTLFLFLLFVLLGLSLLSSPYNQPETVGQNLTLLIGQIPAM